MDNGLDGLDVEAIALGLGVDVAFVVLPFGDFFVYAFDPLDYAQQLISAESWCCRHFFISPETALNFCCWMYKRASPRLSTNICGNRQAIVAKERLYLI